MIVSVTQQDVGLWNARRLRNSAAERIVPVNHDDVALEEGHANAGGFQDQGSGVQAVGAVNPSEGAPRRS